MSASNGESQRDGRIGMVTAECRAEALRDLPVRYSGRYAYNGGASPREGRSFVDRHSGHGVAALENPIYRLVIQSHFQ
jgi:hypothetical protein